MKKLLFLLLLSAGVNAQVFDLGQYLGQYATKTDLNQFASKTDISKLNKRIDSLNAAKSGPVIAPPVADCNPRPTFKIISSSSTGVTIQFDANGLYDLSLTLLNASGSIKSVSYHPESNKLDFPFTALTDGTYSIRLDPITCKTTNPDIQTFTVKSNTGSVIIPPIENNALPAFSQSPKRLMKISNSGGIYTDVTAGDYIKNENGISVRYRDEGGKTYRALYWISEIPLTADGTQTGPAVDFGSQSFPNGLIPSIRKEYVNVTFAGSNKPSDFLSNGWSTWIDPSLILATSMTNITTNGGKNLMTGPNVIRENIPSWFDAGSLIPKYFGQKSGYENDKPVVMQCFPLADTPDNTAKAIREAGINYLWWENLHGSGIYKDSKQVAGLPDYRINTAFNWASSQFNSVNPELKKYEQATYDQIIKTANSWYIPDSNAVFTSEISEGSYPQLTNNQNTMNSQVAANIAKKGDANTLKLKLLGDYGYDSFSVNIANSSIGRKPLDPYYLSLLTPDVKTNLEQKDGSGHTAFKNNYVGNGQYKIRGLISGAYYAITFQNPDRTPSVIFESMVFNNVAPAQPKMRFVTGIMQSNSSGADISQNSDGTIKYDESIYKNYPETPAEFMRTDALLSCLLYDGVYNWNATGVRKLTDKNAWYDGSLPDDAYVFGTQQYARMIPYLNASGRNIATSDYTADGIAFTSTTTERKLSNSGKTFYGNKYILEVMDKRAGFLLVIDAPKKVFIYDNTYKKPTEKEYIVAKWNGKDYDLGEVAGNTMTVFYEK